MVHPEPSHLHVAWAGAACSQGNAVVTQSGPDYHTVPLSPHPPMSTCPSPLPKLRVISEPSLTGQQQILQESSRLLPGGLAQAHEAVERWLNREKEGHIQDSAGRGLSCPQESLAFLPGPCHSSPGH